VLRSDGSLWVNLGDKQVNGGLLLLPQRYAIACADRFGLTVRGHGTVGHVAAALGRTGIVVDRSVAYTHLAAECAVAHRRAVKVGTGKPGIVDPEIAETLDLFTDA
jgi:hypothetical protein